MTKTDKFSDLVCMAERHYTSQLKEHGTSYKGVDWGSAEGQQLRFEQLIRCCDKIIEAAVIDYGCGYGALFDYMRSKGYGGYYQGYDVSKEMITRAEELHKGAGGRTFFTTEEASLTVADYTFASGIFNIKLDADPADWTAYMLHTLDKINALNRRGFAFNVLSAYLDPSLREEELYYADPLILFDHCKRRYSDYVVLMHDYALPDFTILVKKSSE